MAIKKRQQLVQQVRLMRKKNRSFYKVIHISLISQLQKNYGSQNFRKTLHHITTLSAAHSANNMLH
jgi:hypothetical protein